MRQGLKLAVIVFVVVGLYAAFFACAAFAVHRALTGPGSVTLRISEGSDHGDICITLPAVLVNTLFRGTFVNDLEGTVALAHIREWTPAIAAMAEELRKYPEYPLVQIEDEEGERVTIVNDMGKLRVEVRTPDASVDVTLPSSTVDSILRASLDL